VTAGWIMWFRDMNDYGGIGSWLDSAFGKGITTGAVLATITFFIGYFGVGRAAEPRSGGFAQSHRRRAREARQARPRPAAPGGLRDGHRPVLVGTSAATEHGAEVVAHGLLDLVERARAGVAVRPPAHELGGVAEPRALHVVVADLDHALRPQRHERQVLAGRPPAELGVPGGANLVHELGPVPRMLVEG